MSRSRKRSSHVSRHNANPDALPQPKGESKRSKAYSEGKAVKYAYRIHGPRFPVKTLTELPDGSTLG